MNGTFSFKITIPLSYLKNHQQTHYGVYIQIFLIISKMSCIALSLLDIGSCQDSRIAFSYNTSLVFLPRRLASGYKNLLLFFFFFF